MSGRSEEHTSELQSHDNLVCRLLLEKKEDRKSTRLNSSHTIISYAVFFLKKETKGMCRIHEESDNRDHSSTRAHVVQQVLELVTWQLYFFFIDAGTPIADTFPPPPAFPL